MNNSFPLYYAICLVVATFVACLLAIFYIQRISLPIIRPTPTPARIRGGMILVLLWVVLNLFFHLLQLPILVDSWQSPVWKNNTAQYIPFLIKETIDWMYFAFSLCGSAFNAWLLINKRDIFPQAFSWFNYINLIGFFILLLYNNYLLNADWMPTVWQIAGCVFALTIIILINWYVNSSKRSKRTFVRPHYRLVNDDDPEFLSSLITPKHQN